MQKYLCQTSVGSLHCNRSGWAARTTGDNPEPAKSRFRPTPTSTIRLPVGEMGTTGPAPKHLMALTRASACAHPSLCRFTRSIPPRYTSTLLSFHEQCSVHKSPSELPRIVQQACITLSAQLRAVAARSTVHAALKLESMHWASPLTRP